MPLREEFPEAGSDYQGGSCDGREYRSIFAAGTFAKSYEMIKAFLNEEGYGDVPIPETAEDLKLFRVKKRSRMIALFDENGYVHNPIKILFPPPGAGGRGSLILCIYNEAAPDHLLRFHGVK